jgi:hypothetical protein
MLHTGQYLSAFHVAESNGTLRLRSRLPPLFAVLMATLLYLSCTVMYQCLTNAMSELDWQGVALLTSLLVGGCFTSHCRDCIQFDANLGICTVERIRFGFRTIYRIPLNGVVSAGVDLIEPVPGSGLLYGRIELLTTDCSYLIGDKYSADIESTQSLCERINRFLQNQHGVLLA